MWMCILLLTILPVFWCNVDGKYCSESYYCTKRCTTKAKYTTNCGFLWLSRCTRYRTAYRTCSNTCYRQKCCSGYTGSGCKSAICFGSTTCPNGGTCFSPDNCRCQAGFLSPKCTDKDECGTRTHGCQHNCVNTYGSYECTCRAGYTLSSDLKTCIDVNECISNNGGCSHNCVNTDGSFECGCRDGYYSNGFSCFDRDECDTGTSRCSQHCTNTEGSYKCSCDNGFMLGIDGSTCLDIDECASGTATCEVHCKNTIGSYSCSCDDGYISNGDKCQDINECLEDNGSCDQICVNEPGSYRCECSPGYQTYDFLCLDIDECAAGVSGCSHGCVNYDGHFECSCPSGFTLSEDGMTCEDIDDCQNVSCRHNGSCDDGLNSFTCLCSSGYIGSFCETDLNECSDFNGGCQDICTNTEGSFICSCSDGRVLQDDGLSCKGDTDSGVTVFEKWSIFSQHLAKPCYEVLLTRCIDGRDIEVKLASTSEWYTQKADEKTFYTFGITYVEINAFSLPVSLKGIEVSVTSNSFEFSHNVDFEVNDGTLKISDMTSPYCEAYSFDESDIFDFVSADSFSNTFLWSLFPQLPDWLQFRKSNHSAIAVQDMKSDLIYGRNIDTFTECSGAPVIDSHLYSVFRFDTGFSLEIYGTVINLPSLLKARKFCIIADLCQDVGGTIFLMVPEESRDLLLEIPIFKYLKDELNLQIKPRGIGLSLVNGINVDYQKAMQVWNGDHIFQYSVIRTADVWISGDVVKNAKYFSIEGSADMYFDIPNIETMFTSLFRDEWNGLVEMRVSAAPILRFQLFGKDYAIKFTMAVADVDAYVSIGGTSRVQCGQNSNPAGLFFSAFIHINPFMDVPILKNWFKSNIRVYGFVSKGSQEIPSSIDHFSEAIFQIGHVVNGTIDIIETSLNVLEVIVTNATLSLLQTVAEGLSVIQEVVDIYLPQAWITSGTDIIQSVEKLRQLFSDVKHTVKLFIAAVEFVLNETIDSLVSMLRLAVDKIQKFISNTLNSITESILKEAGDYTDLGLKCITDISIFGLQFPSIDLEIIHSDGNLFQCSRFDSVIEFLDGEKAIRFLGRFSIPIKLGRFLRLENGGIGGALASNSNKVVVQFQAVASMLGIRATGDVFITSDGGLYFYLEGNIWNIYFAQIEVLAEVGKPWNELTFVLEGRLVTIPRQKRQTQTRTETFSDSYLDGLKNAVRMISENAQKRLSGVQDSLSKAQTDFTKAQIWLEHKKTDVRNANIAFDKAVSALETVKHKLQIAKGPFNEAIAKLEAAQKKVDNLCRIRTCSRICIPGVKCQIRYKKVWGGRIPYPSCKTTSCMISFPNPLCVLANIACKIVRVIAYLALEAAKLFVRTALLAFDIAQAAVSVAQVIVDKSRFVLRIAEGILSIAQTGLEFAKGILEAAKEALEAVKMIIGAAAHVLQLFLEHGLKNLLDVRNCGFKVMLSTKDLPVFGVHCEVNAFRLGWTKVELTINFKNRLQSIWQAARATISALMKTLGSVFGRKRRSIEFDASSKVHNILRIIRQSADFEGLSLNDTIDIAQSKDDINMAENPDAADRMRSYKAKCQTIQKLQDFLQDAFGTLQETVNDSKSYIDDVSKVKGELYQYNDTENETVNITAEDVGISKEYAAKDYNMTDEDVNVAIEDTILTAKDDPTLLEIKNAANTSLNNIELETKSVESIDFINIWYTAMDNITKEYFIDTECNDFRDCMFYTISSFYELYEAEEFPNVSTIKESILDLESVVIESFQNESTSIIDTSIAMEHIVSEINRLTDMNPFCSEAPTIYKHPKNVTVLLGTAARFNCTAMGDPKPSYWWYKDDILLPLERTDALVLNNISEVDHGTKITCVAGNIVANITSSEAFLLTADFDVDECDVVACEYDCLNTVGSFICVCPDGYSINETDGLSCLDINECQENHRKERCEHICTNFIGGYNCSCDNGYELSSNGHSCNDIDECATENGECDFQCVNLDGSFKCICDVGYVGNGTVGECTDENECETDNGDCEQTCTNTDGAYKCECSMGYELDNDGHTCNDIDECDEDNGGCEHRCVNTEGGYNCTCSSGYYLEDDFHQCSDIDECEVDNGGCQHHCSNNAGSFECNCTTGFELIQGLQCVDIDECNSSSHRCDHNCKNTVGSFSCSCEDGFILDEAGFGCLDRDECSVNNGGCAQNCSNTDGSFLCECMDGYKLDTDWSNCSDIDECIGSNAGCEHVCFNTEGSYHCNCSSGYNLNDDLHQCSDIDECATNNGGCQHQCINTDGSFLCNCNDGYKLSSSNGLECLDIDECLINNGGCDHVCSNKNGTFTCSCRLGYVLADKSISCLDIDECSANNGGCDHECINNDGSFECSCRSGYKLSEDFECLDLDECSLGSHNCEQECENTPGEFSCSCWEGYLLVDDGNFCSDIDECLTNNGGCEHECLNKNGTFACSCRYGYTLSADGYSCEDVDECASDNGQCEYLCINTEGSFACDCLPGYKLNQSLQCVDIDECSFDIKQCGQRCINTDGSFSCTCENGFVLDDDGFGCVDMDECSYDNGGCAHNCTNTNGSYICECVPGYILDTDESNCNDIDECTLGNAGCEHTCFNTEGSYHCNCSVGYTLVDDLHECSDVDECMTNNGGCAHNCSNTDGSYLCECMDGYKLDTDRSNCSDIDECIGSNAGCEHVCFNTEGSYYCNCSSGYNLNEDLHQCSDVDECATNNGGCEHQCTNTVGSFLCSCNDGYKLSSSNGLECLDIDECLINNGGCDHVCLNRNSTFTCSCRLGYVLADDGISCVDIDECSANNGGCDHECINNDGSFECSCRSGYKLSEDFECLDLDECSLGSHNCEQECENTVGSFICICGDGYELDDEGFKCNDVDECVADNGGCDQLCTNTDSSYVCDCKDGFLLDIGGFKCHDIDECSDNNGQCEQLCLNEKGSFQCACNDGFFLESDKKQCTDVNECADDNGGCSHVCENTPGSYQCLCEIGSSWNADNGVCEDIDECSIHNGGCHQECVNTIGSFQCGCKENFVLDRSRFVCLASTKKSFQASITVEYVFVLGARTKRSETLTAGTVKQSLEEFYNRYSSSDVIIVIQSMRTTSSNTEIDYTVVYDVTDSTNLVRATLMLSSGTDLTFDSIAVASRSYLPANITNECHVFETYMEGCDQGQRCEISSDVPTCLDDVEETSTRSSDYLVYILPAVGVVGLCIAFIFVTICALGIRKRREKKNNRCSSDRESESDFFPASTSGIIRHTKTKCMFGESPYKH